MSSERLTEEDVSRLKYLRLMDDDDYRPRTYMQQLSRFDAAHMGMVSYSDNPDYSPSISGREPPTLYSVGAPPVASTLEISGRDAQQGMMTKIGMPANLQTYALAILAGAALYSLVR